jgi:U2 small nuclear ribonucleoprotein A'
MRLSAELLNSAEQRPNPLGERELILRGRGIPAVENLGVTRDAFDTIDFTDNRLTRLENFPRLLRLTSLILAGNVVEAIDVNNINTNIPNITSLSLDNNRISTLHQVSNIGKAFPKLTFLSLLGNPVTSKYCLFRCGFQYL